jgi:type I restriction enzyme S subunit
MSFPRYPKYKASGVEWLGDMPEGWEVKPLRSVFKFSKGLTITKEDLQDEGVQCVNYGEIHSKYGFLLNPLVHPLRCVDSEYLLTNPDAMISDGDFVFADTSEDLEGSGNFTHLRSDEPIFAGYHTIIGRPRKGISPLLFAYQIHSSAFRSQIQKQVKGVKVFSISQGILKATKCLLPPLAEQTAIAAFLDRETGKIDDLVAEQRRLMELLKEKRQAVISHAVTKGVNPHAKMKPSGIEWLGDVPEGWVVTKLGRAVFMQEGPGLRNWQFTNEGTRVICVTNITESGIDFARLEKFISIEEYKETYMHFTVKKGDVLLSSSGNSWGKVAIYDGDEEVILNTSTIRLNQTLTAPLDRTYIALLLQSDQVREQLRLAMTGSCQPNFGPSHLNSVMVLVPSSREQIEIIAFVQSVTVQLDTFTAEAQRAIDLLQERRTALISAAVTGQIDVRQQARN